MEITTKMVNHLAHLARLEFRQEQVEAFRLDLASMVEFIEKLSELKTEGVEPLLFMSDTTNVWRPDILTNSLEREQAMRNAPLTDGTYFKVPTVIKK